MTIYIEPQAGERVEIRAQRVDGTFSNLREFMVSPKGRLVTIK